MIEEEISRTQLKSTIQTNLVAPDITPIHYSKPKSIVKKILALYPEISSKEQYRDDIYRFIYYLSPAIDENTKILICTKLDIDPLDVQPASYLDAVTYDLLKQYRSYIELLPYEKFITTILNFSGEKTVAFWDERARTRDNPLKSLADITVIRADHRNVQHASSLYLKSSSNDGYGNPSLVRKYRKRLIELSKSFDSQRFLLFGTGPSLETFDFSRLPKGEFIVTNSMVAHRELLERMSPRVIVASDPIFHAGVSDYAARFREDLVHAMKKYGSYFVFPMRDSGIYERLLPEHVKKRLIGVPIRPNAGLNTNLPKSFWVGSTSNVMTLFLLPIAASFAEEVLLVGFDGRPLSENQYFWSHAPSFQFADKMKAIQEAHPAFFEIDYDDYYEEHCRTVEDYLLLLERKGINVISLTDSHVPALKGRYILTKESEAYIESRPKVSIILPAYNAENYLDSSIGSVLSQTFSDFELVCIDDGSTDGTLSKLRYLQSIDERIFVDHQENKGVSSARNKGLEYASGEYVCFLDADDELLPDSFARRLKVIENTDDRAICMGRVDYIDHQGQALRIQTGPNSVMDFNKAHHVPHISTIFGPSDIMKRYRFDIKKRYGEDWMYVVVLLRHGWKLYPCGKEPLARYRWQEESATKTNMFSHVLGLFDVLQYIGSSVFNNYFIPQENHIGLNASILEGEKQLRLYLLFSYLLFKEQRKDLERVAEYVNKMAKYTTVKEIVVDDVERIAVRAFLKPAGTIELYQCVFDLKKEFYSAVHMLGETDQHRMFVHPLVSFFMRAEKELRNRGLLTVNGKQKIKMHKRTKCDIKSLFRRRLKKLRRNPRKFFVDSNMPMLRPLANLFR